jgi:hypothetical protein
MLDIDLILNEPTGTRDKDYCSWLVSLCIRVIMAQGSEPSSVTVENEINLVEWAVPWIRWLVAGFPQ